MAVDRKLIRNGNGWALCLNSTILGLLDINPKIDMVSYSIQKETLVIKISDKKNTDLKNRE